MVAPHSQRAAILVANGVDQDEMNSLRECLAQEGMEAVLVGAKKFIVRSKRGVEWGESYPVDQAVIEGDASSYGAVVIPGGVISADTLRAERAAVDFVRAAIQHGIPVAATGHSPWILIEAEAVADRAVTSNPAIRKDLVNAGGHWRDDVMCDGPVITGRHRDDAPRIAAALIDAVKRR